MTGMKLLGTVALSAVLGAAFLLAPASTTPAEAQCRNSDIRCMDRLRNALPDLSHDGTHDSAVDNSQTVGDAVRDCIRCAYEEFKSGLDRLRVDGNYDDDDDD